MNGGRSMPSFHTAGTAMTPGPYNAIQMPQGFPGYEPGWQQPVQPQQQRPLAPPPPPVAAAVHATGASTSAEYPKLVWDVPSAGGRIRVNDKLQALLK